MVRTFRLTAICVATLCIAPALAAVLPPGFTNSQVLHISVVPGPESIVWAPDGALWIAQSGPGEGMNIWVYRGGSPTMAHSFGTSPTGERGIHAIAIDPDWAQNHHVWVYYTVLDDPPIRNRLSRFTDVSDVLTNEEVMLDGPAVLNQIHNGGCLVFAADKTLFLGMGDDSQGSTTAQSTSDLRGKILHLNRDGTGAGDNMFPGGVGGDDRIWAMGVRNPFRCNMQPGDDNLFFGDVGSSLYEEINIGVAGANYGWQLIEGPVPAGMSGFVYPIHSFAHIGNAAVIGGDHAGEGDFDELYVGDYFYGDYSNGEIWHMVLDGNNNPVSVELWATDMGRLVDLEFGPDGALYYAARQLGYPSIGKIEYVGGSNRQPQAVGVAIPDNGPAPLSVSLDGSASSDPDEDSLTFDWDRGDTTSDTGEIVMYSYPAGVYEASLTVDDGEGLDDVTPPIRIVSGNRRPTPTITAPMGGSNYNAGQLISYSGSATDPEEGAIPCSQIGWQVIFHHDDHIHPFLGPEQGNCASTFTIPDRGETSAQTWYRIRMTADDTGVPIPGGTLQGEQTIDIFPNTSMISLETVPNPDLVLTLDTGPVSVPFTVEGVVGFIREIGSAEFQLAADGHTYRWMSWSDAGAIDHEITTQASDTTYTASFGCDVIQEVGPLLIDIGSLTAQGVNLDLGWLPVSDPCLVNGPTRYKIYASSSPVPAVLPGDFPDDPAFTLLGTTSNTKFVYDSPPEHAYFLVVATGTDLLDGALGHYGQ